MRTPGRDLGVLLKAREGIEGEGPRVWVQDVDEVVKEEQEQEERGGRGRSMMKVDSRERREVLTPREQD